MTRVLIVDDQAANRILLASLLEGYGYETGLAGNGHDALDCFPDFRPDIVLLDVMMPGLSGYELAPKLKAMAGGLHLPIIFITALDDQATLLRCLSVGGDDFLSAPFEPVVLQAKLRAHERVRLLSKSLNEKNRSLAWHSARIEREHSIVEHIFRNALSRNFLDYEHIQTYLSPASMFSGDLCLVAAGPLGNIYVFLGDFTGHGLAPATGALPLSQAFFTMTERGVSVAEMATEFNQRLVRLLPDDMFCAAIILELSASGDRLNYWNGGMPEALLLDEQGEVIDRLSPQHMALGILEPNEFDSRVASLGGMLGHRVVLYTDGVTELLSEQHQPLGEEALEHLLTARPKLEMEQVIQAIERFRGDEPQRDDLSLAILSCQPTAIEEDLTPPVQQQLPFALTITLGVEELKSADPVITLMNGLGQIPSLKAYRTTLFMLLSEAYNNALEHGLLGLSSELKDNPDGFWEYYKARDQRLAKLKEGRICIHLDFSKKNKRIDVQITNSGDGWSTAAENSDDDQAHGRGLELLHQLTTDLRWGDNGRTIAFSYPID